MHQLIGSHAAAHGGPQLQPNLSYDQCATAAAKAAFYPVDVMFKMAFFLNEVHH